MRRDRCGELLPEEMAELADARPRVGGLAEVGLTIR
jgi:hypothetical protein